jgi:hypothetical protein
MKHAILAAVAAAGLALTGCGGSTPPKPPSIASIVQKLGCAGFERGDEIFTQENGTCTFRSDDVDLATFSSAQQRDQWMKAGEAFGGGITVTGDLWAVNTSSQDVADAVKARLGGTEH